MQSRLTRERQRREKSGGNSRRFAPFAGFILADQCTRWPGTAPSSGLRM